MSREAKCAARPAPAEAQVPEMSLQELKRRCKAAERHVKKLETQRDNLAARLLGMRAELSSSKANAKASQNNNKCLWLNGIPGGWASGVDPDDPL